MDRINQLCLPQLLRDNDDFFKMSASRTQIQSDINNSYRVKCILGGESGWLGINPESKNFFLSSSSKDSPLDIEYKRENINPPSCYCLMFWYKVVSSVQACGFLLHMIHDRDSASSQSTLWTWVSDKERTCSCSGSVSFLKGSFSDFVLFSFLLLTANESKGIQTKENKRVE